MGKVENQVFLNDKNIIEMVFRGAQSPPTILKIVEKTKILMDQLRGKNLPILLLVDITGIDKLDSETRKTAFTTVQEPYAKLAVFGASRFLKYTVGFIFKASGKDKTSKVFDNKDQALAWLQTI